MIEGTDVNDCWENTIRYFLKNARSQHIQGREYMAIDDVTAKLNSYTCKQELSSFCPWKEKSRDYHLKQTISPGIYSELSRLYHFAGNHINQYNYAVECVKRGKRIKPVVISLYDPSSDSNNLAATPCLCQIMFDLDLDKVNMYATYSVMNLFRIGILDFHQVAYLHHKFAGACGKQVGKLSMSIMRAYMPVFDYIICNKIFDERG
jgi:thymidylate synthase